MTCLKAKRSKHNIVAPLSPIPVGYINQRVHIDIAGPLPITPHSNRYLLVLIDSFSNWIELIAIPNIEAITIARALSGTGSADLAAQPHFYQIKANNSKALYFKNCVIY